MTEKQYGFRVYHAFEIGIALCLSMAVGYVGGYSQHAKHVDTTDQKTGTTQGNTVRLICSPLEATP